jgi:predicted dehydrogenase
MTRADIRIGLLGLGDIAGRYARTLDAAPGVTLVAAASSDPVRAEQRHALVIPVVSTEALLERDDVDLVVNLTPPSEHAGTTLCALKAGKHVYSEKPLATDFASALSLVAEAEARGLILACAPASFLGPAQQTARQVLERGALGTVWGASASLIYPGPDLWHHDADRLFAAGAGVVFDMGVYDVSALVHLLGPVRAVCAGGGRVQAERSIRKGPRAGERFPVVAITHAVALLRFVSGATATLTLGFDGLGTRRSELEIYGSAASLSLPRSGEFAGDCHIMRELGRWDGLEPAFAWSDAAWPVGVLETANAIRCGRRPRASAETALHVLEVLLAIDHAIRTETSVDVSTRPPSPEPLSALQFADLNSPPIPEPFPC